MMTRLASLISFDFSARLLAAFLCVCMAVMALPAPVQADSNAKLARIEATRFGVHPDKTRMVLELSEKVPYRVFMLADPYRVVVDMPQTEWKAGFEAGQGRGIIKGYRFGHFQGDTWRLVLDAHRPMAVDKVMLLGRDGPNPPRFVIDVREVKSDVFAMLKGRSFGDYDPGGAQDAISHALSHPVVPQAPESVTVPLQPAVPASVATTAPPMPTAPVPAAPVRKRNAIKTIVIDAGHGGVDPGAIAVNGVYEKTIALSAARLLRDRLQRTGRYKVVMTRDSDRYLKLHQRVAVARKAEGDLFISIHADSINRGDVRGASIYTLSDKASDAQAARLAARENKADLIAGVDLGETQDDVANILIDLARRETMNQSKRFSQMLENNMSSGGVQMLGRANRSAGFAVLKAPDIPSVLVEMGFLSNSSEAARLTRKDHQQKIVNSIASGIDEYFNWLEVAERL
ncbi:MAG: hypothetical protein Alpg2KO_09920 [Alphaproteobacteria bacterium]